MSIENGNINNGKENNPTLDEYYEIWCENSGKQGRKATTYMNYRAYYKAHVKATELGKMDITKIRKTHCQKLFNKMIEAGSKKSTLNNMKGCLSCIFSDAEDDNIISKNPCKNIRFNNTISGKRDAISEEQVQILMEFLKNDDEFSGVYPLFVVIFNLGVRIGEVCGITRDKVDMDNSSVRIEHSLNRYRKSEYGFTNALGTTKSKDSKRVIVFNDLVADSFNAQRKYQLTNSILVKTIPIVDDYGRVIGEANNLALTQLNGSHGMNRAQLN